MPGPQLFLQGTKRFWRLLRFFYPLLSPMSLCLPQRYPAMWSCPFLSVLLHSHKCWAEFLLVHSQELDGGFQFLRHWFSVQRRMQQQKSGPLFLASQQNQWSPRLSHLHTVALEHIVLLFLGMLWAWWDWKVSHLFWFWYRYLLSDSVT